MNIDRILQTLNEHAVDYLLIGGINFLLQHEPIATFDVDVWVSPTAENLSRVEAALNAMGAEWGRTDSEWGPVSRLSPGWLRSQSVFCTTTTLGSLDVFLSVPGLDRWTDSCKCGVSGTTGGGVAFVGLCDEDMLRCQLALPEASRKVDRIRSLERTLREQQS